MKNLSAYLLILVLMNLSPSCGPDWVDPCANCFQDKPAEGILTVKVSRDQQNGVPITIRIDKLESLDIYLRDTIYLDQADYWVPVGNYYTVSAEYQIGSKKFLAVDGDRVTVYLDDSSCSTACWRPNDGETNCELEINSPQ